MLGRLDPREAHECFMVYRHRDVAKILGDSASFSSSIIAERFGPVLGGVTALGLEGSPHRQLRQIFLDALRPAALRELTTTVIESTLDDLIEEMTRDVEPDLVRDVATQLPTRVIAALLGFEDKPLRHLYEFAGHALNFAVDPRNGLRASRAMRRICEAEIARHRASPGRDNLTTRLISASIDGRPLTDD